MEHLRFKCVASQAKSIYLYKNTRSKLLNACANLYFNKQCLAKNIVPKYANIRFPNTSPSAQITTRKAQITRIKDEIKFLHKKKEKLNLDLYHLHLQGAKEWGSLWDFILRSINKDLNLIMESKYKHLELKIKNLTRSQSDMPKTFHHFFPRVINKTNISFTIEEMALLNKGLKYSLHHKDKHWLSNLALEAEAALNPFPRPEQEHIRHQVAHNLRKLHKLDNNTPPPNTPVTKSKSLTRLRKKLSDAKAMVTEADKGNSMVIIYESDYSTKVRDFISNNNSVPVLRDVSNRLQCGIKNTINDCEVISLNRTSGNSPHSNLPHPHCEALSEFMKLIPPSDQ